jgi:hypothetical protein
MHRRAAVVLAGLALTMSSVGLAACSSASVSETSCKPATPASAMASHGSLTIRSLRRDVVTIIGRAEQRLAAAPPSESGGTNAVPPALGDDLSLMAMQLAALHYPLHSQSAAQAMVTQTQSLAASLRSGQASSGSGSALISAVSASQQFYKALGIPSVCTTTSVSQS